MHICIDTTICMKGTAAETELVEHSSMYIHM